MKKHTVDIKLENNAISCSPHRVIADMGDSVEWNCEAGPFTVDFGWNSPFADLFYRVAGGDHKKEVSIRDNASRGKYEYFVALYDAKSQSVYTLDPDMIVKG